MKQTDAKGKATGADARKEDDDGAEVSKFVSKQAEKDKKLQAKLASQGRGAEGENVVQAEPDEMEAREKEIDNSDDVVDVRGDHERGGKKMQSDLPGLEKAWMVRYASPSFLAVMKTSH